MHPETHALSARTKNSQRRHVEPIRCYGPTGRAIYCRDYPYIGYFHLIDSSSLIVFYDDVNYITRGWINRNRILLNGKDFLFTIPIAKASRNRLINETELAIDNLWWDKFNRTLTQAYRKAPYFSSVADLIASIFSENYRSVSDLAINSISRIYDYLDVPLNYTRSSICSPIRKD